MSLRYACTVLAGKNKVGLIKPDADGYRKVILGALNYFNGSGMFYDWERSKEVFDASGVFLRKIGKGNLYGEMGHPDWEDGWSLDEFVGRIRFINDSNVSHHIREIEIVDGPKDAKGRTIKIIHGWVKPSHDKGILLENAFNNPHQNVCFSIRSLIDDKMIAGEYNRKVKEVVTFDWVTEPGIDLATKYNAPGLEHFAEMAGRDIEIPKSVLETLRDRELEKQRMGIGFESDSLTSLNALIGSLDPSPYSIGKPVGLLSW